MSRLTKSGSWFEVAERLYWRVSGRGQPSLMFLNLLKSVMVSDFLIPSREYSMRSPARKVVRLDTFLVNEQVTSRHFRFPCPLNADWLIQMSEHLPFTKVIFNLYSSESSAYPEQQPVMALLPCHPP